MSATSDAAKDYFAGLVSGVAMVAIGHPFDTVKVHLQTQNTGVRVEQYRGALQCSNHILRTEGVRGLYKGATSSFVGVALESSLLFGAYTQVKVGLQGGSRESPELSTTVCAAATAGAGISAILCPTELVKCRLQVQAKRNPSFEGSGRQIYSGPWDVIQRTIRQEGVRGLYRGLKATALRESIGNVIFFCTYENVRFQLLEMICGSNMDPELRPQSQNSHQASSDRLWKRLLDIGIGVVSGGCAGVAFWLTVLPLDVVKTRIQTAKDLPSNTGTLHLLRVLYQTAGLKGLYAGLGPTLTRAFPANAAAIVAWEFTAQLVGVGSGSTSNTS